MEDENENNTFIKIFGSDNTDFNNEKNTTSDQFLLFSKYLNPNDSFNDYNNDGKPTNYDTIFSEQNKTNLFENEKSQTNEIYYNLDEIKKN